MSKLVPAIRPDVRANPHRTISPPGRAREAASANCRIAPAALYFPPPVERVVRNEITVTNLHPSESCIYRVRSNDPRSFTTTPRSGIVPAGRVTRILIGNVPPSQRVNDAAAPLPMDARRFKVSVRMIPHDFASITDVNELWKALESTPIELEVAMPVYYSDAVPPNVTLLVPTSVGLNVSQQEAPSLGTSLAKRDTRNVTFSNESRPPSSLANPSPTRRTPHRDGGGAATRNISPRGRPPQSASPTPPTSRTMSPRKAAEGLVASARLHKNVTDDVGQLRAQREGLMAKLRETEAQNASLKKAIEAQQAKREATKAPNKGGVYVAVVVLMMLIAYAIGVVIDRNALPPAVRLGLGRVYRGVYGTPEAIMSLVRETVRSWTTKGPVAHS